MKNTKSNNITYLDVLCCLTDPNFDPTICREIDPKRVAILKKFFQEANEIIDDYYKIRWVKLYNKCDDYYKKVIDYFIALGFDYNWILSYLDHSIRDIYFQEVVAYLMKCNLSKEEIIAYLQKMNINNVHEEDANKFLSMMMLDSNNINDYREELEQDFIKAINTKNPIVKNMRFKMITGKVKRYSKK